MFVCIMSQQIPPDHRNHETTIAICRTCQNLLNFICTDKVTNKKFPGIATHPNAKSNHCENAGVYNVLTTSHVAFRRCRVNVQRTLIKVQRTMREEAKSRHF